MHAPLAGSAAVDAGGTLARKPDADLRNAQFASQPKSYTLENLLS